MRGIKITQSITNRQDDSLRIFFKEISKIPMIDSEKEIELARRIKDGDESAINELVKANLRFVVSVAKQYQNRGMDLVDLIQEGVIGLINGARKFDESKGFKFISYAVWWIRQAIMLALSAQCKTVKIPINQVTYINKINKVTNEYEQKYNRLPSITELEYETGLDSYKINTAISSISKSVSLDVPFKDDESSTLVDILPNKNAKGADNDIEKSEINIKIEEILSNLPYRDRDILRMTFGINMSPMQNEEIANRFGLTCERVRQIQSNALKYLKNKYGDELRELL